MTNLAKGGHILLGPFGVEKLCNSDHEDLTFCHLVGFFHLSALISLNTHVEMFFALVRTFCVLLWVKKDTRDKKNVHSHLHAGAGYKVTQGVPFWVVSLTSVCNSSFKMWAEQRWSTINACMIRKVDWEIFYDEYKEHTVDHGPALICLNLGYCFCVLFCLIFLFKCHKVWSGRNWLAVLTGWGALFLSMLGKTRARSSCSLFWSAIFWAITSR